MTSDSALPDWLNELLPPDRPVQTLRITDDKVSVELPDGTQRVFESLADADDATRETVFDTYIEDERADVDGLMVTYPSGKGTQTVILSHTDADRRKWLEDSFENSQKLFRRYYADPTNFAAAWAMIDSHPAFWTLSIRPDDRWHWNTEGYCSQLRQWVTPNGAGAVVRLEAGGHVPTKMNFDTGEDEVNYMEHYGDWRLEVSADSFENAILELARRVAICFKPDGTDRPEATAVLESYKPEWVHDPEKVLKKDNEES